MTAPPRAKRPSSRSTAARRAAPHDGPDAPAQPSLFEAADGPDLRAWVDGGARGNPGPAGYGAYIEDAKGNIVGELSGYLGETTNNVAEYRGLLAALQAAREMGARSLLVHADSELVVKQMNGQYKVKNEKLKPLFLQARALAAQLPKFAIRHVRREENRDADRLANEAMDRGA
jgi:ribonuclease HI